MCCLVLEVVFKEFFFERNGTKLVGGVNYYKHFLFCLGEQRIVGPNTMV